MDHGPGRRLAGSGRPLCEVYDTAMFDLDGVVYVGASAVPGAPERISKAQAAGMRAAYVTNNASRPPAAVAEHLRELGLAAQDDDVVTSAQAAARMVSTLVPEGAAVLVVGGAGLVDALSDLGLRPVRSMEDRPAAVVQGFDPDVGWRALAEAVAAVDAGLPWVASNLDSIVPTPRGRAPGNGLLVDVVAGASGQRPRVAGKPESALFEETVLRVGGERPLIIGDRIDTDIEGAVACGLDSLLVMTGVTDVAGLCAAPPGSRPTYLAHDLEGLLMSHPEVRHETAREAAPAGRQHLGMREGDAAAVCRGWTCRVSHDHAQPVSLTGTGDQDDALRALVSACWTQLDSSGALPSRDEIDVAWQAAVSYAAR